jgi:hypothetical protein
MQALWACSAVVPRLHRSGFSVSFVQCVHEGPSASQGDDLRFRVVQCPARTREFLFKPSVLCCFLREFIGMLQVASVAHLNDVNIVLRPVRRPLVAFVRGFVVGIRRMSGRRRRVSSSGKCGSIHFGTLVPLQYGGRSSALPASIIIKPPP